MFGGPTFQTYYLNVDRMVADVLSKESHDYLLNVDYEQFLNHLVQQIEWQPLEWDEGGVTIEPFLARRQINDFGHTVEIDEPRARLRIPFKPHPQRREFFKFKPSSQHSGGEPDWRFEGDVLVMDVKADENAVKRALEEIRFWIGGRNNDIQGGNAPTARPDRLHLEAQAS